MAVEMAKNARWYHVIRLRNLVRVTSRARLAKAIRNVAR
jgi:hypothetical protein